jgi:hypothetical protein
MIEWGHQQRVWMTAKVLRDRADGRTDDRKTAGLGLEEHRRESVFRLRRNCDRVTSAQERFLAFAAHPALEAGIDPETSGQCFESGTLRAVASHADCNGLLELAERMEQTVEPFHRYEAP